MKRKTSWLSTGSACGIAVASLILAAPAQTQTAAPVDVYVLAGQSNMSGRGPLAQLSPAEQASGPTIRVYGNDGKWRDAREPLDDATDQIDAVSADRQAAVGPGLFFARALPQRPRRTIALVPCAKGGTSIGRWAPGGGRDTLYGSCIARIKEAGGRVAGILWYQGESDGEKKPDQAAEWTASLGQLIDAFRRDLGDAKLPVAVAQISDKPQREAARYPAWEAVQQQQKVLAIPCVRSVPTIGLPRNNDELHLATAGQRILGKRLADAMTQLQRKGCRG